MKQEARTRGQAQRTPSEVLDEIFATSKVVDASGESWPVHSGITREQGDLLRRIVADFGYHRTAEVGCAFGISSLFICSAKSDYQSATHLAIDPYQDSYWHGAGRANLERAGCHGAEIVLEPSEFFLPSLAQTDAEFDFAFIDGNHAFQNVFIDFFYLDLVLRPGGKMALHDTNLDAVREVVRLILSLYPNYRIANGVRKPYRLRGRALRRARSTLTWCGRRMPDHAAAVVLGLSARAPTRGVEDNNTMLVLEKRAASPKLHASIN